MILRVRLPSGRTERVTLPENASLSELGGLIESRGLLDGLFSLHGDPKFATAFDLSAARHGDFVYVKGNVKEAPAVASSAAAPKQPPAAPEGNAGAEKAEDQADDQADGWRPRCLHGPRGMCESCMPKEDKRERYKAELAKWKGRGMSVAVMEALEALKCKVAPQKEAWASAAAVDTDAANEFQSYLAKTHFSQQRVGICYGRVDQETGETSVLAIYEPPQRGDDQRYVMLEGEDAGDMTSRADALAEMLGLKKVGVVFSNRPRKCILSALDVVFVSRILSSMPKEDRKAFVVLVVSPAETGETHFEAYQISDLAVELYESEIFESEEKQKPNGGRVLCKEQVLVEGADTKKVHTEFFILNIPIKSCDSWLRTSFAVENRDIAPQGPSDVKKAISDESMPYTKRLSDFHLLLFLSNMFDMKTDMPGLVAAVKAESDEVDEGFVLMIEGVASS